MTEPTPEQLAESILTSTKSALGLAPDYTDFDAELILHINSVLANLHQLGIGPIGGFMITDAVGTWTEFIVRDNELQADPRLNHVKSYMALRVRMLFDPPTNQSVISSFEKMIEQAEWRIMVAQDDYLHPLPVATVEDIDEFGDEVVLDGGAP
jgi:hypothetical protein